MYVTIGAVVPSSDKVVPGKKFARFFFGGCNFRCPWCYDHKILDVAKCKKVNAMDLLGIFKKGEKIAGVEFTGGEPTEQKRALEYLARLFKSNGLMVKVQTNGSNPGVVGELLTQHMVDYIGIDIKAPFGKPDLYAEMAGLSDPACTGMAGKQVVQRVRESVDIAKSMDTFFEIVVPVVAGVNDKPEHIRSIANDVSYCNSFVIRGFDNMHGCFNEKWCAKKAPKDKQLEELAKVARDTLYSVDSVRIHTAKGTKEI